MPTLQATACHPARILAPGSAGGSPGATDMPPVSSGETPSINYTREALVGVLAYQGGGAARGSCFSRAPHGAGEGAQMVLHLGPRIGSSLMTKHLRRRPS